MRVIQFAAASMPFVLAGCAAMGDGETASLITGPTEHSICAPSSRSDAYTAAFDVFWVRADAPVTIGSVGLADIESSGATLAGAELIELRAGDEFGSFGLWAGYPPRFAQGETSLRAAWQRRVPAVGATLTPGKSHSDNLILHLVADPSRAAEAPHRAPGVSAGAPAAVTFSDHDGGRHTWTSHTRYVLRPTCKQGR